MKILLVQNSFLGDTILSTPVIEALSTRYRDAELWMLTTPESSLLVRNDPLLAGVLTFDKRRAHRGLAGLLKMAKILASYRFDKVFSLHRSWRTAALLWMSKIPERIGFQSSALRWAYTDLRIRENDGHEVERNLSILGNFDIDKEGALRLFTAPEQSLSGSIKEFLASKDPYVAVFPGSVWETKRWKESGYRELAQSVLAEGVRVLVLGAPSEVEICEKVSRGLEVYNFTGKASLEETMLLVSKAKAIICNDSMPLHMASSFKVPTVSVFCATSPEFGFGPWRNRAIVVQRSGLSCKPCRRHGSNYCPVGTFRCSTEVLSEEVFEALKRVWDN